MTIEIWIIIVIFSCLLCLVTLIIFLSLKKGRKVLVPTKSPTPTKTPTPTRTPTPTKTPTPTNTPIPKRERFEPFPTVQPQTKESTDIISYLARLYPTTDMKTKDTLQRAYMKRPSADAVNFFKRIPSNELIVLYQTALEWYYTPLVQKKPFSKNRYTLANAAEDTECMAYLTDGTDIGSTIDQECQSFTCSAFQSQGNSMWGVRGGTPYQMNLFIKPYGRRHGVPNYSYVESVAFPCEGLGRILYNAGSTCSTMLPVGTSFPTDPLTNQLIDMNSIAYQSKGGRRGQDWSQSLACRFDTVEKFDVIGDLVGDPSQPPLPAFGQKQVSDAGTDIGCWITGDPEKGGSQGIPTSCFTQFGGTVLCSSFGVCTNPCIFTNCNTLDTTEFPLNMKQKFVPKGCFYVKTSSVRGLSSDKCTAIDATCKPNNIEYPLRMSGDEHWLSWLFTFKGKATDLFRGFENIVPNTYINNTQTIPGISPSSVDKTMFYWCKGYGKFINFGKTGVYLNYNHFLLTCPQNGLACMNKTYGTIDNKGCDKNGEFQKVNPRWSFPQIVTLSDSYLKNQIKELMNVDLIDRRQYLSGFCTTLRTTYKTRYEGILPKNSKGYVLNDAPNKYVKWGPQSVGNIHDKDGYPILYNPADETFLKLVEKMTISKYYPPEEKIKNPCYMKKPLFTPFEAVVLCAAMQIYGDTGNDCTLDIPDCGTSKKSGRGTFPFGSFFTGSNVGGCVYKILRSLGWDSVQITQMPTGAGRSTYCTQPGYDFEIVLLGQKQFLCSGPPNVQSGKWTNSPSASLYMNDERDDFYPGFCLLDVSKDWKNYIYNGFIQGTGNMTQDIKKYNLLPFQGPKSKSDYAMVLTEINNPPEHLPPNTQWYPYASPGYWNCSYKDKLISNYKNGVPDWLQQTYDSSGEK